MIRHIYDDAWVLDTPGTTYAFRVLPTGQLEHLYYGKHIGITGGEGALDALIEKHAFAPGNTCIYDSAHPEYSLEDMRLEVSSLGKGDLREPFIEITFADGSSTCDFIYDRYEIDQKVPASDTLPTSYDESGKCEHLCVFLKEKVKGVTLELHYYVYEDCDCICKMPRLLNASDTPVTLKRLMSNQIDFDMPGYVFTTFGGAWTREMQKSSTALVRGKFVNSCISGESSHRANPFVMLHTAQTTEDEGDVYAFNLLYSGNHMESAEVSPFGKTRFLIGINPDTFEYKLNPGDSFDAPEAVMTFSHEGFNEMETSALKEIGNIITGAYLNSLSELTRLTIVESIPDLTIDMAGAILSVPAVESGMVGDKLLMIQTSFTDDVDLNGYFILVPDVPSYGKLLKALGVMQ